MSAGAVPKEVEVKEVDEVVVEKLVEAEPKQEERAIIKEESVLDIIKGKNYA